MLSFNRVIQLLAIVMIFFPFTAYGKVECEQPPGKCPLCDVCINDGRACKLFIHPTEVYRMCQMPVVHEIEVPRGIPVPGTQLMEVLDDGTARNVPLNSPKYREILESVPLVQLDGSGFHINRPNEFSDAVIAPTFNEQRIRNFDPYRFEVNPNALGRYMNGNVGLGGSPRQ